MKHIILRGSPGVGKSTLANKLIEQKQLPVCGFVTEKVVGPDGLIQVFIHSAAAENTERRYGKDNLLAQWTSAEDREVYTQVFETRGVALLENLPKGHALLMDEIGLLERDAIKFQQAICKALDGDLPVVAVVKNKENSFLDQVVSHSLAQVYDVTVDNRDSMFYSIFTNM